MASENPVSRWVYVRARDVTGDPDIVDNGHLGSERHVLVRFSIADSTVDKALGGSTLIG